jgi:hypothetical protein
MKVQFEFSPDDLAQLAVRAAPPTRWYKHWRFDGNLAFGILGCAVVFVISPGALLPRAVFSILFCVVTVLILHWWGSRNVDGARLRLYSRHYRETLGTGPFLCEVVISPVGVEVRQFGASVARNWSHVVKIESAVDGIEFTFQPQSLLIVRNPAFASPEMREEFLSSAQAFRSHAVTSSKVIEPATKAAADK